MAHTVLDNFLQGPNDSTSNEGLSDTVVIKCDGQDMVHLPDVSYVEDASMVRDGADLVLDTSHGTVVLEDYFSSAHAPNLFSPEGKMLTPDLVDSFIKGGDEYADAVISMNDVSPVGAVHEVKGDATITRVDGSVEHVEVGTPVYQGDVVETDQDGALNIMFIDETTFAVSEDARLAIDEYVFDPATQSGTTNFSVLKGVFVFTSGLIGRDDPDDVMIETPSGSIGIRGTIIAGNVDTGEITVIEGAIVLHDHSGNSITLANQYETARFNTAGDAIDHMGDLAANDVAVKFGSLSSVSGDLFSSIEDSSSETINESESQDDQDAQSDDSEEADDSTTGDGEQSEDTGDQSSMDEVITSEDIVETEVTELEPLTETSSESSESSTGSTGAESSSSSETTAAPPPPPASNPFQLQVTKFALAEGASSTGQPIMQVTGLFTSQASLQVVGISKNFYEVVDQGNNNFLVKLKAGVEADAENLKPLALMGTAANGQTVVQVINPNILNVDEPTTFSQEMPNVLTGAQGSYVIYDFSQDFNDPEGILSFQLNTNIAGQPGVVAGSVDFNASTGILKFYLDPASATGAFTIDVAAVTSSGVVPAPTYNFVGYDANQTFSISGTHGTATTSGTYADNGALDEFTIAIGSVNLFTDIDNLDNIVHVMDFASNFYGKLGGGNDTIDIASNSTDGFEIYGGGGSDIFIMRNVEGDVYGGDGNDQFQIDGAILTDLMAAGTTSVINGGEGNDLLHIATNGGSGANINFNNLGPNVSITNIEKIASINGEANGIAIGYDNVMAMTDDKNILFFDMDSQDALAFHNTSGNQFFNTGVQNIGGESYNVYTDGVITLLVDTDAGTVTGLPA